MDISNVEKGYADVVVVSNGSLTYRRRYAVQVWQHDHIVVRSEWLTEEAARDMLRDLGCDDPTALLVAAGRFPGYEVAETVVF